MFITHTQDIIYSAMVNFTYIPFQGIVKRKCHLWGKICFMDIGLKQREKTHTRVLLGQKGPT